MPATNKKAPLPGSSRSAPRATSSSNPLSKKRKANSDVQTEEKFYAVRAGKKPGIYTVWKDCENQITGFRGAQFKKFTTREEAQAFIDGRNPPSSNNPPRYYGVAVGRNPGVYTDYAEVEEQVRGVKGPKQKRFDTYAEADAFVRNWRTAARAGAADTKVPVDVDEQPPAKKLKKSSKSNATDDDETPIVAYTDGSSRGNGKAMACAGVGVWFGHGDSRNICERLPGMPQTNQRAELTAILRCLQVVPRDKRVEIRSDSKYSIQCATVWSSSWEKNDWKGDTVKNRDIIEKILALIKERKEAAEDPDYSTQFTWIKGHSGHPGNEAADSLAVEGSRLPLPEVDF